MIYHDLADALTADEARTVIAAILQSIEAHDEHRQTMKLLADIRATVTMAENLAYGVPYMASNYGEVELPGLS